MDYTAGDEIIALIGYEDTSLYYDNIIYKYEQCTVQGIDKDNNKISLKYINDNNKEKEVTSDLKTINIESGDVFLLTDLQKGDYVQYYCKERGSNYVRSYGIIDEVENGTIYVFDVGKRRVINKLEYVKKLIKEDIPTFNIDDRVFIQKKDGINNKYTYVDVLVKKQDENSKLCNVSYGKQIINNVSPFDLYRTKPEFNVGDKVMFNYKDTDQYYNGTIKYVFIDADTKKTKYYIVYEYSDTEYIYEDENRILQKKFKFNIGNKVVCDFKSTNGWYNGTIKSRISDSNKKVKYDIAYDDSDTEYIYEHENRILLRPKFKINDHVSCFVSNKFYSGYIKSVHYDDNLLLENRRWYKVCCDNSGIVVQPWEDGSELKKLVN